MTKPTTATAPSVLTAFPFETSAARRYPKRSPHVERDTDDPNAVVGNDADKRNKPSRRKSAPLKAEDRPIKSAVDAFAATTASIDDANCDLVVCLLESYLTLQPEPSDEQVHHLAKSLGVSKEALEEVMFNMLSDLLSTDVDEALILDENNPGESDLGVDVDGIDPTFIGDAYGYDGSLDDTDSVTLADADDEMMPGDLETMIDEEDNYSDDPLAAALSVAIGEESNDTSDAPNPSTIINPTNTDERLSSDGEPDPYSMEQIRQGAPTRAKRFR